MSDSALLREILDAQLETVCRFRADGTILFVNRAYARTLEREPQDLTGRNLWDFVTGEDQEHVREMLRHLTPDQPELTIENRFEAANGTRWMLWRNHALEFDATGAWSVAQSTGIDITQRKELEEQLELLVGELNHRVKNTLMVVQAMAHQTFRGAESPERKVSTFTNRLSALSGAHDALSRTNWAGARLIEIVRQGLLICGPDDMRVDIAGPDVLMPAGATVSLVMVLHELATNAMKYGALSGLSGRVSVHWTAQQDGMIEIDWVESGGPEVIPPSRKGFGSRLLTEAVPRQLGGRVKLDYDSKGLRCQIAVPQDRMA
ncbi:sensor histidine kinase [Novosphingobium taihuense]|uniref:histidine kinase n=1 Tax=Novosphingobium taihuense TaxID=260085 RepID=A0A7W7EX97_9SPHN|nr:HWE histidine kinase domain-containing protein [Novosphingobium taihuense]MBB4615125.1 PAS domain S-box-containing protein [Novosphingobium taihuense]TWH84161.1 PAS domain S-box-containing protein [Novosphingobium taihuense]